MLLIFRLIYRHISRRRMQSILFVLGVALGVAVGLAIDLANTSATRAFTISTENIAGETTHQIVGSPSGIDESLYTSLQDDLGIETAAPIVETYVRGVDLGDQPLRLLGINLRAESPFRSYLAQNEDTPNPIRIEDFTTFLLSPDAILISKSLADRFDLHPGETTTIRVNTEQVEVLIGGLLLPNDSFTEQALDDLLLMDIRTAQKLLDMQGRITRIDLILPDAYDTSQITALLPAGATLTTPATRSNTLNEMTRAFEINLQALSLLALVVGVFLIYNTVMFSVVQRRQVIGIMRSLGTSKRQIFLLVIGEAFLLGFIGTVLGLGLGIVMAQGTVGAISQTISDLYFRVNVQNVTITPVALARGAMIGVLASLFAAVVPSVDATRTTPAGSMRRSDLEQQTARLVPYVTGVGLVLILIGLGLLQIDTDNIVISFAALFSIVVGAALFTPLGMIILSRLVTPLTGALFGVLGRMAPRALIRSISRTSVAVAALTLAVSVIVGVGVMVSSFRSTVEDWLNATLGADIFISTPGLSTDSAPNVDPTIIDQILQVDGVVSVPVVREVNVIAPDYPDLPPANITAVDMDLSHGRRRFVWTDAPEGMTERDMLEQGKVMVSEPFAFHRNITRENNTITLLTDRGEHTFEIFAVYYDYTSDQGSLRMDLDIYRQFYDDPYVTSLAVILEPDANVSEVIDTLRTQTLVGYDLEVQSNRELRTGALEVFDRTFSITIALQILATIVAFIGILSALMALQLEHIREYGIMRANGMTASQLRIFTLLQTGIMGAISGVLALPIGFALAMVLIYVINVRSFGWSMSITLPPKEFIQAFLVALLASLLAGIYPAWKVSSIQAADALRSE